MDFIHPGLYYEDEMNGELKLIIEELGQYPRSADFDGSIVKTELAQLVADAVNLETRNFPCVFSYLDPIIRRQFAPEVATAALEFDQSRSR